MNPGGFMSSEGCRWHTEKRRRTMNVKCPHCRTDLEAPEDLRGQSVKCPQCSKPFTVPRIDLKPKGPLGLVISLSVVGVAALAFAVLWIAALTTANRLRDANHGLAAKLEVANTELEARKQSSTPTSAVQKPPEAPRPVLQHPIASVRSTGTEKQPPIGPTVKPHFDGLYQKPEQEYSSYLRFYDDGTVISGNWQMSPNVLRYMFMKTQEKVDKANYVAEGNKTRFSMTSKDGQVDYECVVGDNGLTVNWTSKINGKKGTDQYKFVPWEGAGATPEGDLALLQGEWRAVRVYWAPGNTEAAAIDGGPISIKGKEFRKQEFDSQGNLVDFIATIENVDTVADPKRMDLTIQSGKSRGQKLSFVYTVGKTEFEFFWPSPGAALPTAPWYFGRSGPFQYEDNGKLCQYARRQ
jgi:uncharacterized protein (TIGR03067 family)